MKFKSIFKKTTYALILTASSFASLTAYSETIETEYIPVEEGNFFGKVYCRFQADEFKVESVSTTSVSKTIHFSAHSFANNASLIQYSSIVSDGNIYVAITYDANDMATHSEFKLKFTKSGLDADRTYKVYILEGSSGILGMITPTARYIGEF